ncbi:hypothetical protein [Noviherbaspirillum saxi]|uniref:Beta sliding clamp n=1 Tax=Noviherbaspirillum saxi TaxID=2320863 RepID=A0A3A3FXW3_9BURK|nr:hypothetical protein [Noviherbaspirillum saxi]RJF99041.1 hypothetical protein D3871_11355 [Noviherbaspirillum saxi]
MILSKSDFRGAVDAVTPFARTKSPLPILTHVKVESTGKRITFTASHIDSQIEHWIDATGEKFAVCIDAAALKKFASVCDADVSLTVKGKKAVLECGDKKTRLNTLEADTFPMMKKVDQVLTEIEWKLVEDKIAFAVQFCGMNPSMPQLNCLQLNSTGAQLEIFATDTKKIGFESVPHIATAFGVCIPNETARHMVGSFVSMVVREEQIELRSDNAIALFKTAPYKPVKIDKFITRAFPSQGEISRKSLLEAINFVGSFSDSGKIRSRVEIHSGDSNIVKLISTENEASAPFDYSGAPLAFGAFPDEFSSFLKSVETDKLKIEFDTADMNSTPIRLTNAGRVIIAMPVAI